MATAVVTGGCGFLGSHLAERLMREGFHVISVDNFCTGSRENGDYLKKLPDAKERLRVVEADVCRDWNWLEPTLQSFSAPDSATLKNIFHFASPASPPHYQRLGLETMWVNSVGLSHAIEHADLHKARVIFASTSEVYGDPEVSPQPESYRGCVNTVGPRSCYDEAKRFGESLIYTSNIRNKTHHGLVRIFNTYGPRMNPADGRVVINFLVQALNDEPLTVYGEGSQTRSFCYVDDLIEGIWRFSQSSEMGPVNIGNEKEFSILELAKLVQKIFAHKELKIEFHGLPTDDPRQRRPDLSQARQKLGWEPRVPLEIGLKSMIAWLETV